MTNENSKIHPPAYFSEIGERSNNEDALYPMEATTSNRLFMVCDGVGGQKKGEVAAALVSRFFAEYINSNQLNSNPKDFFASALTHVEGKLGAYLQEHPDCTGMATTLTLLLFAADFSLAYLIWVGDSRIYHIRDGDVLFQTKDHSEVQELVHMGEITQEEARTHPRRNVITRAITGASKPSRIDYQQIEDLQHNDFFLLCSDGLLETLTEAEIKKWFRKEVDPQEIKKQVYENAVGNTKDNYTMYLIKMNNP